MKQTTPASHGHASSRADRRQRDAREHEFVLARYFAVIGTHPVLTAAEEVEHGWQIRALRRQLWVELLSHPAAGLLIEQAIVAHGELPELLHAGFVELATLETEYKTHRARAVAQRVERAIGSLAEKMATFDMDCTIADRLVGDVHVLAEGGMVGPWMKRARPRSRSFFEYAHRVVKAAEELRTVRDAFVRANLRLVLQLVRRLDRGLVPFADLVQEGNLGLVKAVYRFDPGKGCRFSTYASWWIRHAITRAVFKRAGTVRLPVHVHATKTKLWHVRRKLQHDLGREPTGAEVAGAMGLAEDKLAELTSALATRVISLDGPIAMGGDVAPLDELAESGMVAFDEQIEREQALARLEGLLDSLSALELEIVRKRFGLDQAREHTLQEIGEQHALSRERIRQLQNRALQKLRDGLQQT